MFSVRKPDAAAIRGLIERQHARGLSYDCVGVTRVWHEESAQAFVEFDRDHCRVELGRGAASFAAACRAIDQWRMFDIEWLELCWPNVAVDVGAVVGVLARPYGLWCLNACRVAYVIDERSTDRAAPQRYGFAYGTLPKHIEQGEERFVVEWRDDGSVWYDLLAVSRPGHWLSAAAYPVVRRWQAAFRRDSCAAMLRAVSQTLTADGENRT
ncbi:MAG: DUF1990 domain-containing protein [Planctomycetales bacterium]|nr:DUF1990 domain-containing protein [Planctomycetales bacterium]